MSQSSHPISLFFTNNLSFNFRGVVAIIAVLAVGITACDDGPTEPEVPEPEPEEITVAIDGTVTSEAGDEPVEGADVAVYLPGETNELDAATTDDEGTYELAFVIENTNAPDELDLAVAAEGFGGYEASVNFSESISYDVELTPDVVEGSVSGTITDSSSDDGVEDAVVTGSNADSGEELFEATTDESGDYEATFEVEDDAVSIVIAAEADGYEPQEETADFDSEMTVDMALTPETMQASASGTVAEQGTFHALEDVTITGTRSDTGAEVFQTTTNSDGSYQATFDFEAPNPPADVTIETAKDKFESDSKSVAFSEDISADFELAWDPPFDEDCTSFDPDDLTIDQSGDSWRLIAGTAVLLSFDEYDDAQKTKEVIEFYGFSNPCYVTRPDPDFNYWLVEGTPAVKSDSSPVDEDCVSVNPDDLTLEQTSDDRWRIISGPSVLLTFDEYDDAQKSKEIIEFYEFTNYCFVSRPGPEMRYWLR